MDFAAIIGLWYRQNARPLPWRETRDPYFIWLSEVILQQTRVDQGLRYYLHFAEEYPSIEHLAKAPEEKILKSWQGLGYYSRARNLHSTAKFIVSHFGGKFPDSYEKLLELKGIGPYTAAAISSFAFREQKAVVDGNVARVLSRYFGITEPIDSTRGKKQIQAIADELIPANRPDLFNQAIMEFGALQCVPKSPKCEECPLREDCFALKKKCVSELPVKGKKTAVKDVWLHCFLIHDGENYFVRQRDSSSIWKNLYELPSVETETESSFIVPDEAWKLPPGYFLLPEISEVRHQLSHRTLHVHFSEVQLRKGTKVPSDWKPVPLGELPEYAIPRLTDRFLRHYFNLS
jgi:A/G-specific adenine glycosylase